MGAPPIGLPAQIEMGRTSTLWKTWELTAPADRGPIERLSAGGTAGGNWPIQNTTVDAGNYNPVPGTPDKHFASLYTVLLSYPDR